ncbi:MAG: hypothetical protein LBQ89_04230 [Treponema sp.]|jgi:hypothetical protein|nr:hypothetical protein [Treponema sp.]
MYLDKTAVSVKTTPEQAAKNVPSKTHLPAQTAKPVSLPAVPRSASALAAAAGLPVDKLSTLIVSYARFFSLPLKPELLAAIRRQAFMPPPPAQTATTQNPAASVQSELVKQTAETIATKNREVLSLAAAAAESKGVELQPRGLRAFAEAIDPDWRKKQEGEEHRRQYKEDSEREEEKSSEKTSTITVAGLRRRAEATDKNPLLAILNRMPGKNGRWIVFPFDFRESGREFKVSMRILLETGQVSNRAVCMALDIVESVKTCNGKIEHSETERHRLFVLEAAGGQADRLTVYLQPELPHRSHFSLISRLSRLLEIKPERISVKSWTEPFPCEASGGDQLCSIDEAV